LEKKEIKIYTDGACSGNPGPGGYGTVLIYNGIRKELSGGYANTTNNRMEIMAVLKGLEALKESCRITVYSDSKYVVDAIEKGWVEKWRRNNWMRNNKEKALNVDLWQSLLALMAKHEVCFQWVKGHHTNEENNRCDQLAVQASRKTELPEDIRE
jgi:ribonuclease HI